MKLLLDTHIWLWALGNPAKLSKRVRAELENPVNEIRVSSVSTWETLCCMRNIEFSFLPIWWFTRATSNSREAPLTHEIAFEVDTPKALRYALFFQPKFNVESL